MLEQQWPKQNYRQALYLMHSIKLIFLSKEVNTNYNGGPVYILTKMLERERGRNKIVSVFTIETHDGYSSSRFLGSSIPKALFSISLTLIHKIS